MTEKEKSVYTGSYSALAFTGQEEMKGLGLSGVDALSLMESGWRLLYPLKNLAKLIGPRLVSPGLKSQLAVLPSDALNLLRHYKVVEVESHGYGEEYELYEWKV